MTLQAFWTLDVSGNWSNGADWSTQVMQNGSITNVPIPPPNGYDVSLTPGGGAPFTVTYDTTATEHTLTGQSGSTLDIAGGVLTLTAFSAFSGAVQLDAAGRLDVQNGWQVSGGFNEAYGATAEVDAGVFSISTGTIDGIINGAGKLYLMGGDDFTLAADAAINTGTLELGVNADGVGSRTTLAHPFAYNGTFELDNSAGNAATLDIGQHMYFVLQNTGTLDGVITGPGTFIVDPGATAVVAGPDGYSSLSMTGGAQFQDGGEVMQYQSVTSDGQVIVEFGGSWDFATDAGIGFSGTGRAVNYGLIEKTGGTGTSVIQGPLDNTRLGTVTVDSGTIAAGNVTNDGLISGPGAFVANGIFNNTGTIDVGALTATGHGELGGKLHVTGALTLQGNYQVNTQLDVGTLALNGATLQFGINETIAGQVVMTASTIDIGTLTLTGPASLSGLAVGGTISVANGMLANFALSGAGSPTMVDTGVIVQDGSVALGTHSTDHGTLSVIAGATYDMTGPVLLGNANVLRTGTQTVTNAGLFEKTGSGTATVWHSVLTSTGTLAATGTLALNGGSAALSGVLTGAGDIQLAESWTLAGGTKVTVGTLENAGAGTLLGNVTDQGAFVNDGGATLALGGHLLTLATGGTLGGTIDGAGTLRNPSGTLALAGFTLGGGATLGTGRLVNQTGGVTLGDGSGAGTLTVNHGGYDITGDSGIAASGAGSAITNAGIFAKTGGTGTSVIAAAFSSSGTVAVTSGTLEFTGGFTSTGTIIGTETQSGGITFITAAALGAAATPGFLAPPDPAATLAPPALTDTGTLVPPPGDASGNVAAWTTPEVASAGALLPYAPDTEAIPGWLPQQS